jgi:hypothetical protein
MLERNHRKVNSMVKPFVLLVALKYIKESTLERHITYVSNVEKPSLTQVQSMNIFIGRSRMYVSNVGKPSFLSLTFKHINDVTVETNPLYGSNMADLFLVQ